MGTWVKDAGASDMQAMGRALDAMRLGGIQASGRGCGAGARPCWRLALPCRSLPGPPSPSPLQKHCALNLITGLQIAARGEDEVELRYLTDSWVVSGLWGAPPRCCCATAAAWPCTPEA